MGLPQPLVSVEWLKDHLQNPALVILDASLPKPKSKPGDNPLNHLQIPGARFFDIDGSFSDKSKDLPHMMPSPDQFEKEARKLGINQESWIVIYDNLGVYSSPRARWMLKAMGHKNVAVLDGGLPEWHSRFECEEKQTRDFEAGDFVAHLQSGYFKNSKDVLEAIGDSTTALLDARSAGRFAGTEPEPRLGLRGGHIPNSLNLPFPDVVDEHKMKPKEELKRILAERKVDNKQLIFSCGSGLTACIIALAAEMTGYDHLSVYDGSWSEWGAPSDLPVVTT